MRFKAIKILSVSVLLIVSVVVASSTSFGSYKKSGIPTDAVPAADSSSMSGEAENVSIWINVYNNLALDSLGLSASAFEQAITGFSKLKTSGLLRNDSILTIADFSKPSTAKRLYVLDLAHNKLLYHTYVAHGVKSGKEQALNYSNKAQSHKSSPGFYATGATYIGSNGYSLKLAGLEKGINDNAFRRAIVVHGADYVSESLIQSQGYLGRSYGCPAIPAQLSRPIINTIKDGSCLFIYAPVKYYAQLSRLIR